MSQTIFEHYKTEALALALALANQTHTEVRPGVWEPEGLRSPNQLRALLEAHGWSIDENLSENDVAAARQLRDDLRAVFTLAPSAPMQAIAALNTLLAEARPRAQLVGEHECRLGLSSEPRASLVDRLRTTLPLAVAYAVERHGLSRLRRCADAPASGNACTVVFLDTSKNGRSRFCGPQCASRTHVAAFRRRERDSRT